MITITGLGDHDPPEWLITITGLRNLAQIRVGISASRTLNRSHVSRGNAQRWDSLSGLGRQILPERL